MMNEQIKITKSIEQLQEENLRRVAASTVMRMTKRLEAELARVSAVWTKRLTEATQQYRAHLRDETRETVRGIIVKARKGERLTAKEREALLIGAESWVEAGDGLDQHDEILAASKADKAERGKMIKRFWEALREILLVPRNADPNQKELFADPDAGMVDWATKPTQEVLYSALCQIQSTGAGLDEDQKMLLVELGAAGLDPLDLGIAAEDAVEADAQDDDGDGDDDGADELSEEDVRAILN